MSETCPKKRGSRATIGALAVALINKEINKWPAIMFAASRMARVKGRIIVLTVSITTIKGINTEGVPLGIRCTKEFEVLLAQA